MSNKLRDIEKEINQHMDTEPIVLLMAEDDPDDRFMVEKALKQSSLLNRLYMTVDGEDLLEFLQHKGKYSGQELPRPDLILLDLNMPRKDGREALREIKSDPDLRQIPVVVLTTSEQDEDIFRSYDLGVNSFITKPVSFSELVRVMDVIDHYWCQIVKLPNLPPNFHHHD